MYNSLAFFVHKPFTFIHTAFCYFGMNHIILLTFFFFFFNQTRKKWFKGKKKEYPFTFFKFHNKKKEEEEEIPIKRSSLWFLHGRKPCVVRRRFMASKITLAAKRCYKIILRNAYMTKTWQEIKNRTEKKNKKKKCSVWQNNRSAQSRVEVT